MLNGGKGAQPTVEIDGRNYTVEANQRSRNDAAFVGTVANSFLAEWIKGHGGDLPVNEGERHALYAKMFSYAEEWRHALRDFEGAKLEEYERKIRSSTKLHLPDAGMMENHLPPGSIPNMGR